MVSKGTNDALIQDTLKLIKKDLNSNNQELKEYAKEQLDKLIAEGVIDDKYELIKYDSKKNSP
jgi:hypothetical protein